MHVNAEVDGTMRTRVQIDQKGDQVTVTVQGWNEWSGKMKTVGKYEHGQVKNLDIKTGFSDDFISTSRPSRSELLREEDFLNGRQYFTDPKADDNHANKNVTVNLTVDSGDGNDVVIGSNGKNILNGGSGNDRLIGGKANDAIDAGSGDDYVEGAAGDDRLQGGKDKDVIYGNRGNDEITDIHGLFNYLEGGKDDDHIVSAGSRGKLSANTVSAGRGNDIVDSHGFDTIYTGAGKDKVNNLGGKQNTIYAQWGEDTVDNGKSSDTTVVDVRLKIEESIRKRVADDGSLDGLWRFLGTGGYKTVTETEYGVTPGRAVRIEGSAEFRDRMEDDIDMYRSSPTGQTMLKALDESAHSVTLREPSIEFSRASSRASALRKDMGKTEETQIKEDGTAGQQKDALVAIQPSYDTTLGGLVWDPSPVVLFHELSHAYNFMTGTSQPGKYSGKDGSNKGTDNFERQAVGLHTEGIPYDFDHRPDTPPTTGSPFNLTENGLRLEMNVPVRTTY